MLAVARALMSSPRCLLLDEPSLGLSPKAFGTIIEAVRRINAEGIPVLIAEQNVRRILSSPIMSMCWKPAASSSSGEGTN